jgi:hypothetical protein
MRHEEIQKLPSYGENNCEFYYPHNYHSRSPPDQLYHNWPTHIEGQEAECYVQDRKEKGKEMFLPIKKENESLSNTNPPYANQVMKSPFPDNFKIPSINSYNGKGDPIIHIENFQTHPSFYNIPDETARQVFPLNLKREAREWFDGLEFTDSFSTIKCQFLDRFSAIHKKKQHPTSLFFLKQG